MCKGTKNSYFTLFKHKINIVSHFDGVIYMCKMKKKMIKFNVKCGEKKFFFAMPTSLLFKFELLFACDFNTQKHLFMIPSQMYFNTKKKKITLLWVSMSF